MHIQTNVGRVAITDHDAHLDSREVPAKLVNTVLLEVVWGNIVVHTYSNGTTIVSVDADDRDGLAVVDSPTAQQLRIQAV